MESYFTPYINVLCRCVLEKCTCGGVQRCEIGHRDSESNYFVRLRWPFSNLFVTRVTSSNIVCARWISIISINHHQASKVQIETQILSVCLSVRSCSRFGCKDPSIIKWVCKLWKNVNLVYLFLHIFKNSSAANEYLNILK